MTVRPSRQRFILGTSAAAAVLAPRPVRSQTRRPLAVACLPSTLFAPVFVAQERGYFTDAGFDSAITAVNNGSEALAFAASGRIDLMAAGMTGAYMNAVARKLDVRYAASTAYQPVKGTPAALMIRQDLYDAGQRTPDTLRGKTVSWVGNFGPSMYYIALIFRKYKMTLADIRGLVIGLPEQAVALQNKATDAIFTNSPFTEVFRESHVATTIAVPPPGVSTTGIFAGKTLLNDRGALRSCMEALRRAAAEISGAGYYRPENIAAYAKYTKLSIDVLKAADRYDFKPALAIDGASVLDMQRVFIGEGVLEYKAPLALEQLVVRA